MIKKGLITMMIPIVCSISLFFVMLMAISGGGIAATTGCLDCEQSKKSACSGAGGPEPTNEEESVALMYSFFTEKGWSKEAIAGMLGNAQAEGGFDPTSVETVFDERFQLGPKKMSIMNGRDKSNRSFPGIGLLGFTYFREEILEEAEKQGLDWYSMEYQMPYIEKVFASTAWNPYFSSFDELKQSKDIEKVSTAILTCYEKPKVPLPAQRAGFAKDWYDRLDSLAVASCDSSDSDGKALSKDDFLKKFPSVDAPTVDELRDIAKSKYGMTNDDFILAYGWISGWETSGIGEKGADKYADYLSACVGVNFIKKYGYEKSQSMFNRWPPAGEYSYHSLVRRTQTTGENEYIRKLFYFALTNLDTRPIGASGGACAAGKEIYSAPYAATSINHGKTFHICEG